MLSIKEILAVKPQFILAVNYDAGSIGEMVGEDRDLNLYLAEMTIQYKWRNELTLIDHACLAFTVECLVSVNDNIVTIDEMNTSSDMQAVYANNIKDLPNGSHQVWGHDIDSELHTILVELMENQPIYNIPTHYTIEAY